MGLSLRGQSSGAIDINAPNVAGNNTITLPGNNGAANQFYKNSGTAGTLTHSSMVEDTSGKIGIGITNPEKDLEVSGSSSPTIRINNSDSSISANQTIGVIEFKANDTSNDGSQVTGSIESISQAAFSGQGSPSHLIFKTNGVSGPGALDERLRIAYDNTVHIGNRDGNQNVTHFGTSRVSICGPDPVPTSVSKAGSYLAIGNNESELNGVYPITFGYTNNTYSHQPAYIAYKTTNSGGAEYGDLLFGTRNVTTDTEPTERLRITSAGKLVLPTSSPGIQFGSNDTGTNITSQTLDDYEEGTWTPTLSNFTLGNGTLTGQYTKIGNIVHLTFRLDAGSTTTFTGAASGMAGFPFTNVLASNTGYLTASNPSNNWFGWTQQYSIGSASNYLQWVTSSSNQQVGSATQPFTWGSSTIMRFNMTYRAA